MSAAAVRVVPTDLVAGRRPRALDVPACTCPSTEVSFRPIGALFPLTPKPSRAARSSPAGIRGLQLIRFAGATRSARARALARCVGPYGVRCHTDSNLQVLGVPPCFAVPAPRTQDLWRPARERGSAATARWRRIPACPGRKHALAHDEAARGAEAPHRWSNVSLHWSGYVASYIRGLVAGLVLLAGCTRQMRPEPTTAVGDYAWSDNWVDPHHGWGGRGVAADPGRRDLPVAIVVRPCRWLSRRPRKRNVARRAGRGAPVGRRPGVAQVLPGGGAGAGVPARAPGRAGVL